jgi:sirohydrochlorin ferrochelatase
MSAVDVLVYAGGSSKPFGELTLDEVRSRARELRESASAGGPTARVLPVAMAWAELARLMESEHADRVSDLGEEAIAERAEKLWVIPPGGSLL